MVILVQVEHGWGALNRRDDGSPGGAHGKVDDDDRVGLDDHDDFDVDLDNNGDLRINL